MKQIDQKAVAEEFDKYRDTYSDAVNDALIVPGLDVDYFTKVKAQILLDQARAIFGDPGQIDVLDVGCGIGNYHPLLKGAFHRLVGVDVSPESIDRAKERNTDVEYLVYDGRTLPFEDTSFDIAYAICVVHHVPVPMWENFFAELHRVLKPSGRAMIFEHNPLNPLTMRVVNRCPFDRDAVLLKQGKTTSLLGGAGFADVSSRTFLNVPSFNRLTRQLDQMIGVLPTGAQYLAMGTKR